MSTLVTAAELGTELASATPPRVLDARWSLAAPNSYAAFLAGHLPGAAYVDLEDDAAQKSVPTEGRHPLPSAGHLQQAARRWGLNDGDKVVVYDADNAFSAARVQRCREAGSLRSLLAQRAGVSKGRQHQQPRTLSRSSSTYQVGPAPSRLLTADFFDLWAVPERPKLEEVRDCRVRVRGGPP